MNAGLAASFGAFFLWGLFPLYWKQLADVPPIEIMAHRLLWCLVFVLIWLGIRHRGRWWRPPLADRRTRNALLASGSLIGANWWLYIWAVNNGHIVESSLGYFINPLINIALGTVLLQEKLNRSQWLAIFIAALGVAWLSWDYGRPPWIALTLACTFGTYGLLRKVTSVGSVEGLAIETALLLPVALLVLLVLHGRGEAHFGQQLWPQDSLLILGGIVTAIPLILFAYGARRIPYSTIGIIQYLGPSLQLLTGVVIYGERFDMQRAIGFILIWSALALYATDGLYRYRQQRKSAVRA